MRLSVCIDDVPGSLARLLGLLFQTGSNILDIDQVQGGRTVPLFTARVDLEIETRGPEHQEEISKTLRDAGYRIRVRMY